MSRNWLVGLTLVGLAGGALAGASCNLIDSVTCGDEDLNLATGHVGNFGSDEAARKVEAFLQSTVDLNRASRALADSVTQACKNIGAAIGVPAAEMEPSGGAVGDADRVRAACTRASREVRAVIQGALPNGAKLSLTYTPPVCEVSASAYVDCAASCDVNVRPGELRVDCEPGSVQIGRCEASCSGECWVEGSASCSGSCSATCTGSCTGNCYGSCSGTCSYIDGSGNCAGTCSGTCTGRCDATCTGGCTGSCRAEVSGGCTGECHGSCSETWVEPPRCEVFARPAEVSADCHASCDAEVRADIDCTRPSLEIDYGWIGGDADAQARLRALVAVLRTEYPTILRAGFATGEAFVNMVGSFFDALDGLGDMIGSGLKTAACIVQAATVSVQVSATFSASVEATGSMTASVSATGSVSGP
jgi:hypothetical protein